MKGVQYSRSKVPGNGLSIEELDAYRKGAGPVGPSNHHSFGDDSVHSNSNSNSNSTSSSNVSSPVRASRLDRQSFSTSAHGSHGNRETNHHPIGQERPLQAPHSPTGSETTCIPHKNLDRFNNLICVVLLIVFAFLANYRDLNTEPIVYQLLAFLAVIFLNFMGGQSIISYVSIKWSSVWTSFDWVLRLALVLLLITLSVDRPLLPAALAVLIALNLYFNYGASAPDPRDERIKELEREVRRLAKRCQRLERQRAAG